MLLIPRVSADARLHNLLTFPQFLGKLFDARVAWLAGIISAIGYIGFTSSQMLAGAKLASATFPALNLTTALLFMGIIAVVYTVLGGIGLFALLSFIFIWKHHDSHRIIVARNPSTQAWFPEVEELRVRLKKAKTANQLKLALFDMKFNEFNERLLQAKGEEWLPKPRRDRELIFMLLNQWSNEEICTRLSVSETHLYRLRSKLRCDLGLASDDLLIPALLAWSS